MKVNLGRFPKKINGERKISVKIESFDTWSMDHSLALIIHPMLLQLKKTKHGSPSVDDVDVPEEIRSTSAPPKEFGEYDTDEFHHDRWEWVLNEMIWAFAQKIDNDADDQFYSGVLDIEWKQVSIEDGTPAYEMVKGPNDTHVFDKEGWEAWNARKTNGFRLFGRYFEGLWD
jgi:hypothetical protein